MLYNKEKNKLYKKYIEVVAKKSLNAFNNNIECYSIKSFRYLAIDILLVSITQLEEYSKEKAKREIESYLKSAASLVETIANDFSEENLKTLQNVSSQFFKKELLKEFKNYNEIELIKNKVKTIKKENTLEAKMLMSKEYIFLQNLSKVLNIMEIILKIGNNEKEEKSLLVNYQKCVNHLWNILKILIH